MLEIIKELNENLKKNIAGYKAMAIGDINSGETLFAESLDAKFDIELAAACNLEVIKAKLKAIETLELTESIDKIVINLSKDIHIIDITESKQYFIYLALDASKTTIGLVTGLLNKGCMLCEVLFWQI